MKPIKTFIAATLLIATTFTPVTQSQTKKSRSTKTRSNSSKTLKPGSKAAAPATPSLATTTPSGLVYVITRPGTGRQPQPGETVVVHYTGVLSNGVKFDSSLDRGTPIEFRLGEGRVIKGWDEAIAKLRVGDQATLIIPPTLGYGARGAGGVIPPNATLIFIIELVEVKEPGKSNQG